MTGHAPRAARPWQMREDDDVWLGQLAWAARAGDRGARDALWLAVGPRLVRMALRMAWAFPTLEPDDAVQEAFPVFAALVADWPGPTALGTGFATYLFGLFRWRLHSLLRAYERRSATIVGKEWTTGAPPRADASAIWQEYGVDFPAFVACLPDHERAIFLSRIQEGLGIPAIAARLGLTPRTVSRHWNVTLRRLRAQVRRGGEPPGR